MNFSCLSEAEVREKYRRAQHKEAMIGILADLTCASKGEVRAFLGLKPKPSKKRTLPPPEDRPRLDEARAMEMYEAKHTDPDIAMALGVTKNAVTLWRRRNRLPSNYVATVGDTSERMRLYKAGLNDRQIARELGIAHKTICSWRRKKGLPANAKYGGQPGNKGGKKRGTSGR